MEHNETFVRIRLGAAAEGDEAAELLLWPAARPNGQAVVACPGGGFNQVALEREGYPFARWFNERGVTYAVLCYRMPRGRAGVPAEDIRCALALMRERAAEWGITRLGVMGASIGQSPPAAPPSPRRLPRSSTGRSARISRFCSTPSSPCSTPGPTAPRAAG